MKISARFLVISCKFLQKQPIMSRYPSGPVTTYPWFRCGQQQPPPRCSGLYQLNNFISDVVFSELNRVRSQLQQHQHQQRLTRQRREMSWNGPAMRLPGRQQEEQQFLLGNLQAQLAYEYYHRLESMVAGKSPAGGNPTMRRQQQWDQRRLGDLLTPFLFVYVPLFNNATVPSLPVQPQPISSHQQHNQRAANSMFPTRLANVFLKIKKSFELFLIPHSPTGC